MTTRLVLVLELDGGTPAEVRAYGEQVAAAIRHAAEQDIRASMEWQAAQFVDVRVIESGDLLSDTGPLVEVRPLATEHDLHRASGHRVWGCSDCYPLVQCSEVSDQP